MEIIFQPRASGKTTKLIKMADDYNGYIVCHDLKEASRVFQVAHGMKERDEIKGINMPITYDEFLRGEYNARGCKILYIDNAQKLIQRLASCPVKAITLSEEINPSP